MGPHQHEQVRERRNRHRPVAVRAAGPGLLESGPALAGDRDRAHVVVGVEAGRHDQHVELVQRAVGRAHAVGPDPVDRLDDDLDVVALDGAVEAGRDDRTLAERAVARGQLAPQFGIADGHQVQSRGALQQPAPEPGVDRGAAEDPVATPLDAGGDRVDQAGDVRQQLPRRLRQRHVREREDPLRRALEVGELRGSARDRRNELDAGRAAADDADAAAVELDLITPARGMDELARERVEAVDLRPAGVVEEALGADQHAEAVTVTVGRLELPLAAVPGCRSDFRAKADPLAQPGSVRDLAVVVEDLGLVGQEVAPVWVALGGERVDRRGNVDREARVVVLPPGPANLVRLLEDRERDAAALHAEARRHPRDARPDDPHRDRRRPIQIAHRITLSHPNR